METVDNSCWEQDESQRFLKADKFKLQKGQSDKSLLLMTRDLSDYFV